MEESEDCPYIPLAIVSDILKRIPVKHITRCKIVSKEWCQLLSSRYFIKLHIKHSQSFPCREDQTFILARHDCRLYATTSMTGRDDSAFKRIKLKGFPTNDIGGLPINDIVGCCNGLLLCVYKYDWIYEETYFHRDWLAIVNPHTGCYRKIDKLIGELEDICRLQYGFGYDQEADDYKVVRVESNRDNKFRVTVYSLRADCCRVLGDEEIPFDSEDKLLSHAPYSALINNNLLHFHFAKKIHRLYRFDVYGEKWSEVPLPKAKPGTTFSMHYNVGVLDGCLCVCGRYIPSHTDNPDEEATDSNVWVLRRKDGKNEHWEKLFEESGHSDINYRFARAPILRVSSWKEEVNKLLIQKWYDKEEDPKLVWYHVEDKTIREVQCQKKKIRRCVISRPSLDEIPCLTNNCIESY